MVHLPLQCKVSSVTRIVPSTTNFNDRRLKVPNTSLRPVQSELCSVQDSCHGALVSHPRLAVQLQSTWYYGYYLELLFHSISMPLDNASLEFASTYRYFLDHLLAEVEVAPAGRPRSRSSHAHCLWTMVFCTSVGAADARDGL